MRLRFIALFVFLFCTSLVTPAAGQTPSKDEAGVLEAVKAFHTALGAGNGAAAMELIAPDALMMEVGGMETREQYEKAHLPADIAFEKSVTVKRTPVKVVVRSDVAWVTTSADFTGTFEGRPVDFLGLELMVLSREPAGWRIRAVHWSSRNRRPPPTK